MPDIFADNLQHLRGKTAGHPSITIAVLDGPADTSHTCFQSAALRVLSSAYIASGERPVTGKYPSQHGTHVTSIIFGPGKSEKGVLRRDARD